MSTRLQKQIAIDAAWFFGVLALGGLALGGTMKKLSAQRAAVDTQRSELSAKETRLTDEISAHERVNDLAIASERLDEADALVADESRRISLISSIAESSNMRVISLRSGTERPSSDLAVISKRHELVAVGEHRDLAGFIDALQSAEGAVAIDALQIGRYKVAPGAPPQRRNQNGVLETLAPKPDDTRLRISLEVLWLGVSSDFDAIKAEKES